RLDMRLDQTGAFPHEAYKTLWDAGLTNLEFPDYVGGPGLSCLDHVIVSEELQYGCSGIGTSATANTLAAMPLIIADNRALAKKYLAPLVEAPIYAAYGCSEPDAGSDVAAMSTRFRK